MKNDIIINDCFYNCDFGNIVKVNENTIISYSKVFEEVFSGRIKEEKNNLLVSEETSDGIDKIVINVESLDTYPILSILLCNDKNRYPLDDYDCINDKDDIISEKLNFLNQDILEGTLSNGVISIYVTKLLKYKFGNGPVEPRYNLFLKIAKFKNPSMTSCEKIDASNDYSADELINALDKVKTYKSLINNKWV